MLDDLTGVDGKVRGGGMVVCATQHENAIGYIFERLGGNGPLGNGDWGPYDHIGQCHVATGFV